MSWSSVSIAASIRLRVCTNEVSSAGSCSSAKSQREHSLELLCSLLPHEIVRAVQSALDQVNGLGLNVELSMNLVHILERRVD